MNNNNGKTFPVLALTATATKKTEMSLRETLNIAPENALRNDAIRDNLFLIAVIRRAVVLREAGERFHTSCKKIIRERAATVYCCVFGTEAESVANYLKVQGVVARPGHAGLDKSANATERKCQFQEEQSSARIVA